MNELFINNTHTLAIDDDSLRDKYNELININLIPDCYKDVFNSKSGFAEAIKKDKHIFMKFIESFSESTSKAQITKLTNKFIVLSDLFSKKKGEF